jgi:hypothetical protein
MVKTVVPRMPSRIIREGLLDSERYWSVTVEARQLFWHLMLLADDFATVSLAAGFIRRRCFDDAPTPAKIEKLLTQLHDEDLLRIYEAGNGRYGFIPRFRQRLQRMTLKNPAPPAALLFDDEDAKEKFKKINVSGAIPTVGQQLGNRSPTAEVKGSEEEKKGREVPNAISVKSAAAWAGELGIEKQPNEGEGAFQVRVAAAVTKHKSEKTNELKA